MKNGESVAVATIEGLDHPEDFSVIPGTDWVITSALSGRGIDQAYPHLVNIETHELRPAYPDGCMIDLDVDTYGEISPPPEHFQFHGIDAGVDGEGRTVIYQVNHRLDSGPNEGEGREAVEVFHVDISDGIPSLHWVGAIPIPNYAWGNEVCVLPDGVGLTNFVNGGIGNFPDVWKGGACGQVLEWKNREDGWTVIQGTDVNAPNGLAVSKDQEYYFVASWATGEFHKISRSDPYGDRQTVDLGEVSSGVVCLDNVTWTPNDTLLVAGQGDDAATILKKYAGDSQEIAAPIFAIEVDPTTMEFDTLVEARPGDRFATTVLQVNERFVWAGSSVTKDIQVYEISG